MDQKLRYTVRQLEPHARPHVSIPGDAEPGQELKSELSEGHREVLGIVLSIESPLFLQQFRELIIRNRIRHPRDILSVYAGMGMEVSWNHVLLLCSPFTMISERNSECRQNDKTYDKLVFHILG